MPYRVEFLRPFLLFTALCLAACDGGADLDLSKPLPSARTCAGLPDDATVNGLPVFNPVAAMDGGQFRTAAGVAIGQLQLNSAAGNLEIFSLEPVVVSGSLLFAASPTRTQSIHIISSRSVEIRAGAIVGAAASDQSRAPRGSDGGEVVISGSAIALAGTVRGMPGGYGADANRPDPNVPNAVAGPGGSGGDILLCTGDDIELRATALVEGGRGGGAGALSSTRPRNGVKAENESRGGRGGDIHLIARAGGTPKAQGPGQLVGGAGGPGGNATAIVSDPTAAETEAEARAGAGGPGGVVRFSSMYMGDGGGTPKLKRGDGGAGGIATATGSAGSNGAPPNGHGQRGTDATAHGGDGAPAKPFKYVLVEQNGHAVENDSQPGTRGAGGAATAQSGAGGNGVGSGDGGKSGKTTAQAGKNGDGAAAPPMTRQRQAANGTTGGPGASLTAPANR